MLIKKSLFTKLIRKTKVKTKLKLLIGFALFVSLIIIIFCVKFLTNIISSSLVAHKTWNPVLKANAYPINIKVVGANKIPAGCLSWKDKCWHDAVASGMVKFISTPAVMVGINNRPIVFAYFINGIIPDKTHGTYTITMFYADNGEPLSNDINTNGVINEIDWVYGTINGIIQHSKPDNLCYEKSWYPLTDKKGVDSNIWSNVRVDCPIK